MGEAEREREEAVVKDAMEGLRIRAAGLKTAGEASTDTLEATDTATAGPPKPSTSDE